MNKKGIHRCTPLFLKNDFKRLLFGLKKLFDFVPKEKLRDMT